MSVLLAITLLTDCAGFDFKPFTKYIFVFGDCQKRKCLDIPIKTDDILEGDEIISLLLEQHTNDRRIHPQEIMKNVTITDDYPGWWYTHTLSACLAENTNCSHMYE